MAQITIEIDGKPVAIAPDEARRIYGELAAIFAPPVTDEPLRLDLIGRSSEPIKPPYVPFTITWNQPAVLPPAQPHKNIILNREFFDHQ